MTKEEAIREAIQKVISLMGEQVGYLEKATNSQLDDKTANAGHGNYTKYARDIDAIPDFYNGKKQGYPWCDVCHDWPYIKIFGPELAMEMLCQPPKSYGAGTTSSARYYRKSGRFYSRPKVGDQVFFGDRNSFECEHTGIVTDVDGEFVYTIEGNTSGASGVIANGGGVCRKKYPLTYYKIVGYGRPRWELAVNADIDPSPDPEKETGKIDVFYSAKVKKGWLPEVKNTSDYAGNLSQPILGLMIRVSRGRIKYRVHDAKARRWLPWVTGSNPNDFKNGWAGNGSPIDGVQIYFYTPADVRPYQQAFYKVSEKGRWLGWQEDTSTEDGMDGYAGNLNKKYIDRIQIEIMPR